MLRKLLKYDLRSMLRSFLPLWGAILALSVVNHFTLNNGGRLTGLLGDISTVIPMLVYVGIFIAMVVLTILFILQRFYNGLLRDEGYLMFTLPVRAWQLITSKGLAAVVMLFLSILVGACTILIILPGQDSLSFLRSLGRLLSGDENFPAWQMILIFVEVIVLALLSIGKSIYQVYASIALGHLFRRRVGMAVVMYILISTVLLILTSVFLSFLFGTQPEALNEFVRSVYRACGAFGSIQLAALALFLIVGVQLVVFHIITERVLSRHLNLE